MAMVAYKNNNTGKVVAYTEADPRLEALPEWDRCDESEVGYTTADAHDRALAERESIEAAAAIRFDTAAGAAAAGLAHAAAINTAQAAGPGAPSGPLPTLSTGPAGEDQQRVPLLAKESALRDPATTPFEENKRRADYEIEHPPKTGVLARAKGDHKTGRTQIGDHPEKHAGPAAAAAAGTTGSETGGQPPTVPVVDPVVTDSDEATTATGSASPSILDRKTDQQ